jgi:hypothetical protein
MLTEATIHPILWNMYQGFTLIRLRKITAMLTYFMPLTNMSLLAVDLMFSTSFLPACVP